MRNHLIAIQGSVASFHDLAAKKYFGEDMLNKMILCPDKSLVKGDYLIDDNGQNGQPEFEGEWIEFASEEFPDWTAVIDYLIPTI